MIFSFNPTFSNSDVEPTGSPQVSWMDVECIEEFSFVLFSFWIEILNIDHLELIEQVGSQQQILHSHLIYSSHEAKLYFLRNYLDNRNNWYL